MQPANNADRAALDLILAVIARSQIVLAARSVSLPAGFEDIDIAVLNWIAAEGHRIGRSFTQM
jgi:hypothetical protein